MLTRNQQIDLMEEIQAQLAEQPAVSSEELYRQMYPGLPQFYDFDQAFQYVRSGHDLPKREVAVPAEAEEFSKEEEPNDEENETEETPALIVTSQKEAAAQLEISDSQFKKWKSEPGFPAIEKGYDVTAIRQWRESVEQSNEPTA